MAEGAFGTIWKGSFRRSNGLNYEIAIKTIKVDEDTSREKDKELIFQRFGQVEDTYTRNTSGTGLGLAISKSIISLLGGEIWFDSVEGKGTTFFFKIPVFD